VFAAICVWMVLVSCEKTESSPAGPAFDGERALAYVREFLRWGARVPGTEAHVSAGDWIVTQMRQRADTVYEQRWTHTTTKGVKLPLRNIIARFRPELTERVLYVTHWESRPISENASDPAQRKLPVPGANDGGSGVGLFVALGDLLKTTPPSVGVDLVFVDGEDYGTFPNEDVLIGSKYFAEHLPTPDYQPLFGVVWDMIGDAQPRFYKEGHSTQRAPEVVDRVWKTAASLGYRDVFLPQSQSEVTDDHLPLLDKGLRVIDVIDLDYPYHHTPEDTIDKVSARSLKIAGDVAAALVK
jgi:Zn-dependent M28 family amino/carboxypeptidase